MIRSERGRRFFRRAIVRNALSLYSIQAATYILPWFTFPYVFRVIGPEKYGEIAFAAALIAYFQSVTEYGFNLTATREVSIHRNDPVKLSQIFSATMYAKAILSAGSFIVLTGIVFAVPRFRADAPLFFVTFLVILANLVFPVWLFQGLEKMESITYREVGARLIGLAPTFLLVKKPSDYLMVAAINSGSLILAGAAGYIGFSKITDARLTRVSFAEIRRTFAEGWNVFLSTAAITLYTRSNTFILGLIGSPAEVGYFSAAQRLIEAGKALVSPLTTAIYPHISRLSHDSPREGMAFIRRNTMRLVLPFLLISCGLLWVAPPLSVLLLGQKFAPSIPLLRIMSFTPLAFAISAIYATFYMLGMGYKKEWSRLVMSAGAFNFAVLLPLLHFTSPSVAISITSFLVEVWVMAGSYLFFRRKERVPPVPKPETLHV
jgi:PST family polysaccharide transporter